MGTEACAMVYVSYMLWWGPNLAWQPVPHTWERWIFFHHALRYQMNPAVHLSSAAPVWYLATFDSSKSQMFCSWLWSGTRDREPGHPHQRCMVMQRSRKRLWKPWSRCRYGLMCCFCTALRSPTALMSCGCRWKSQSHVGPTKAVRGVQAQMCHILVATAATSGSFPCKGHRWMQHWTHPAALGWYPLPEASM